MFLYHIPDVVNQQELASKFISEFEHDSVYKCSETTRARATSWPGKERFNMSCHSFWKPR
jgi:hypothetical protein